LLIDISPRINEDLYEPHRALSGGEHQGGGSVAIANIGISVLTQTALDIVEIAMFGGLKEVMSGGRVGQGS
jgi:hypothetical protein